MNSILQCNTEFIQFNSSSRAWALDHHSEFTGTPNVVTSIEDRLHYVTSIPTVPVTTLCDGVVRAGKRRTATQVLVTTITTTITPVSSIVEPYTGSTPTCSLDADACTSLADYQGALFPSTTLDVDCSIPVTYTRCAACKIYAPSATLYHWHAEPTEPCIPDPHIICPKTSPTGSRPVTAEVRYGRTLTSPSLYLSFPTVYAFNYALNPAAGHCGSAPSPTVSAALAGGISGGAGINASESIPLFAAPPSSEGTIIALDPSEISSLRGFHGTGGVYPFNTNDLAHVTAFVTTTDANGAITTTSTPLPVVPSAAYFHTCIDIPNNVAATVGCGPTIFDDYQPTLAWPVQRLRALDAGWVDCVIGEGDGSGLVVVLSELTGRPALPTMLIGASTTGTVG
ncbi:hypothetical protein IWZ03DRAFT_799 [Phyllosticta citriasiana]|uniref:Uncharacterized protein n=1 Tax=Phyllosticta citriasiana TaxID=595635 RepID=A0ABR1KY69_9PEZI